MGKRRIVSRRFHPPLCVAAGAAFFAWGSGLLGCGAIVGIGDVSLDPTGAGGGAQGGGGAASDGGGGQAPADFLFAIKPTGVNVPYNGLNYVDVEIARLAGFEGAIDVAVQGAPAGLVAMPLTLPADATTGQLEVGASGELLLGTTFELELIATSGELTHTDSVPAVVTGKPGMVDDGFGIGGIASWTLNTDGGQINRVRETIQGKILVAGNSYSSVGVGRFVGARLLENGILDTTFNTTGTVTATFCSCTKDQQAHGIMRALSGKVFLAGFASAGSDSTDDIALYRVKDDGTADSVAGDNGKVLTDLGGMERVSAADLTANERIVLTGERDGQLFVARLEPTSGSLDSLFAFPNGWIAPDLDVGRSAGEALAIDAAGRVVIAGWAETGGDRDVVLLRVTTDGALDPTFGAEGVVKVSNPGTQQPVAMAIQLDGKIVVAVETDGAGSLDFQLRRFTGSGAPDPSFGGDGESTAVQPGSNERPVGMAVLHDGRFVIAGNGGAGPLVVRFLARGALDPTFGAGGMQAIPLGSKGAISAMTLSREGKLLLAGIRDSFPDKGFVARVWN